MSPLFAIYIYANTDPKSTKGHTIQHLENVFATPWTIESMEFSRPEYWSILQYILQPFLSPGHLPNPGTEPRLPALWADSLPAEPQGKPENTGVGSLIPSPTDVPNPGIELGSPALQADSLPTELWKPRKGHSWCFINICPMDEMLFIK